METTGSLPRDRTAGSPVSADSVEKGVVGA
jgi:hypothetical protein